MDWIKIFAVINGIEDEKLNAEVTAWRQAKASHEQLYQDAVRYYARPEDPRTHISDRQMEQAYRQILRRHRARQIRRYWAAAAMLLLLIGIGAVIAYHAARPHPVQPAVLAAAEPTGVMIRVDDTTLLTPERLQQVQPDRIGVRPSARGLEYVQTAAEPKDSVEQHTVIVPRGSTFRLTLSDGTVVLLAPDSRLTYPNRFVADAAREVTLQGEACFEVSRSDRRFIVHTDRIRLQVYGTVFNLCSRAGRPDQAVLLEGSVGIRPQGDEAGKEIRLQPGQRAVTTDDGRSTVETVDITEYQARREGYLLYNERPLGEIMEHLELLYDIRFRVEDATLADIRLTCSVEDTASLATVLEIIEWASEARFTIKGKEVTANRK